MLSSPSSSPKIDRTLHGHDQEALRQLLVEPLDIVGASTCHEAIAVVEHDEVPTVAMPGTMRNPPTLNPMVPSA